MARGKGTASATVRATKEPRPKRPKVDRGEKFEQLLRPMFVESVDRWCKAAFAKNAFPTKDERGNVVDNLVAQYTSAYETMIEANVDSYMSTGEGDDDVVECPECETEFDIPEGWKEGEDVKCPSCAHTFDPDEEDEDDDSGSDEGSAEGSAEGSSEGDAEE